MNFLTLAAFIFLPNSVFGSSLISSLESLNISFTEPSDLALGDVLPDGSYSERVIARATQIALNDFNMTATLMSENNPKTDCALTDAFELVKITMNIDIPKFKEPVTKNILLHYTKACISHMLKNEDPAELTLRVHTAHRIKILAFECSWFNIGIPEKQALKLLEFIYRYASNGYRYRKAFYKLLSSLTSEAALNFIFGKFIEHFDPTLQSLPSLSKQIKSAGPLSPIYSTFIRKLYEKLLTLTDPLEDREIFSLNAIMLITNIICFNEVDDFADILTNILPYADPNKLLNDPIFFSAAIKIIPEAARNNSLLLDYFIGIFMNDEVISRITGNDNEIRIGGIYHYSRLYAEKIIHKYSQFLSRKCRDDIKRMERRFIEIDGMFTRADVLKLVQMNFLHLSVDHLKRTRQEVDELTGYHDILMKIDGQRFSVAVAEIGKKLIEICALSVRNAEKKELNIERFHLFTSLLNFLMADEIVILKANIPLFNILRFFVKTVTGPTEVDDILSIVKGQITAILAAKKDFFTEKNQIIILYKFFIKLLGKDLGFEEFRRVIHSVLEKSSAFSVTFDLIRDFCAESEVPVSVIFVPFLLEEMKKYIEVRTDVFSHDTSRLTELISKLEMEKAFNCTESRIIEYFKRIFPFMKLNN